jgi:hypothetical protein
MRWKVFDCSDSYEEALKDIWRIDPDDVWKTIESQTEDNKFTSIVRMLKFLTDYFAFAFRFKKDGSVVLGIVSPGNNFINQEAMHYYKIADNPLNMSGFLSICQYKFLQCTIHRYVITIAGSRTATLKIVKRSNRRITCLLLFRFSEQCVRVSKSELYRVFSMMYAIGSNTKTQIHKIVTEQAHSSSQAVTAISSFDYR